MALSGKSERREWAGSGLQENNDRSLFQPSAIYELQANNSRYKRRQWDARITGAGLRAAWRSWCRGGRAGGTRAEWPRLPQIATGSVSRGPVECSMQHFQRHADVDRALADISGTRQQSRSGVVVAFHSPVVPPVE